MARYSRVLHCWYARNNKYNIMQAGEYGQTIKEQQSQNAQRWPLGTLLWARPVKK